MSSSALTETIADDRQLSLPLDPVDIMKRFMAIVAEIDSDLEIQNYGQPNFPLGWGNWVYRDNTATLESVPDSEINPDFTASDIGAMNPSASYWSVGPAVPAEPDYLAITRSVAGL
jgi:hypothetical protein